MIVIVDPLSMQMLEVLLVKVMGKLEVEVAEIAKLESPYRLFNPDKENEID